jgi:hypothetical protein
MNLHNNNTNLTKHLNNNNNITLELTNIKPLEKII